MLNSQKRIVASLIKYKFEHFIRKCFEQVNPSQKLEWNHHIDDICDYLRACEEGDIKQLIINMPPRWLKSIVVSTAWPAWILGHDPSQRIIVACHSSDLSKRLSVNTRDIIRSDWYRAIFPDTILKDDQDQKGFFQTTRGGFRRATSVHGSITGEGGNYLIVDDPISPDDAFSNTVRTATNEWFDQTLYNRVEDTKTAKRVIVMQRLHDKDLSGYLQKKGTWESLVIPMETKHGKSNFVSRYPEHEIERIKKELPTMVFEAQYNQNPAPSEGNIFKMDWFKSFKVEPVNPTRIVQSWDCGFKTGDDNSYSVGQTWFEFPDNQIYLIDTIRGKWEYPDLKRTMMGYYDRWKPHHVLVEDKASGQSVIQEIKGLPIVAINPKGKKEERAIRVTGMIEGGNVFLPESAPWLHEFEKEVSIFNKGDFDDQVDAMTQAIDWIRNNAVTPFIWSA